MAARFVRDEEAAGSNPATPTQVTGHSHRGKWPFSMPYSSKVQQRLRAKLPSEPLERVERLRVGDLRFIRLDITQTGRNMAPSCTRLAALLQASGLSGA